MEQRFEDIRVRLEQISEELGDLALDLLRRAVDDGAGQRPPEEKPLSQARRAVDKAARHLGSIPTRTADETR